MAHSGVPIEMTLGGRARSVALDRLSSRRYAARTGDREIVVDAEWIDPDTLVLLVDGAVHRVGFQPGADGALAVAVSGHTFAVEFPRRRNRGTARGRGVESPRTETAGSGNVKAPMPGRIVRVLVAAGEPVRAGQALVIVEAMKMENELRAPRDGIVAELRVQAGAAVERGAVLVVVA